MLLLDTHTLIWFLNDDPTLPETTKEWTGTSEHVYVSIATFWEMAIKNSIRKLKLPDSISRVMEVCRKKHISILSIKATHLDVLSTLPHIHKDPFDRLLICQAKAEGLTLLTVDENIVLYDVQTAWERHA